MRIGMIKIFEKTLKKSEEEEFGKVIQHDGKWYIVDESDEDEKEKEIKDKRVLNRLESNEVKFKKMKK